MKAPNSLQQNDGKVLQVVSSLCNSEKAAIDNMCHKAIALLVLANARLVLFQPKQWAIATADVAQEVVRLKESAVGDLPASDFWGPWDAVFVDFQIRGDEGPRVEPTPRRQSHFTPVADFIGAQELRDELIIKTLRSEIKGNRDGIAWPSRLHRGRWRVLDHAVEVGMLKAFIQKHPDKFTIVEQPNSNKWGIAATANADGTPG